MAQTENLSQSLRAKEVVDAMNVSGVIRLRNCNEHVTNGEWIPISNGSYLNADFLAELPFWDQQRAVAVARAYSTAVHTHGIASGLSAVLLRDVPLLNVPNDVSMMRATHGGGTPPVMPAVWLNGSMIMPESVVRRSHTTFNHLSAPIPDVGITAQRLSAALVDIARIQPAEQAFIALCMGLHQSIQFAHVRTVRERAAVEESKEVLLSQLQKLAPRTHGVRRARLLIEAADGSCDSVGEARVLWLLKCAGVQGLQTQHMVSTPQGTFYVDVGIPSVKLAIEFDGFSKYSTSQLVHQQWSDQHSREQAIRRQDYLVHRFQWESFKHPGAMINDLNVELARVGLGLPRMQTPFSKAFQAEVPWTMQIAV